MVARPGEPSVGRGFVHLELATPRVRIACFSGKWAVPMDELLRVPDIQETFQLGYFSVEALKQSLENPREFVLVARGTEQLIGWVQLADSTYLDGWLDLRYAMLPAFRRQGLCQEALRKLLPYALDLWGFPGVSALVPDANPSSRALAASIGMKPFHHPRANDHGKTLFILEAGAATRGLQAVPAPEVRQRWAAS